MVARDGGIPLTWHAYPGNKPDVAQFPDMIAQLKTRYRQSPARPGSRRSRGPDRRLRRRAEQRGIFAHLATAGLRYVGSMPASDCPDLIALPASVRTVADADRFSRLTAYDTRRACTAPSGARS